MKIKITGLRFPEFHDENSKKRKQIGQVGEVGGNGYVGFYFIPDNREDKFERYDMVHFHYTSIECKG